MLQCDFCWFRVFVSFKFLQRTHVLMLLLLCVHTAHGTLAFILTQLCHSIHSTTGFSWRMKFTAYKKRQMIYSQVLLFFQNLSFLFLCSYVTVNSSKGLNELFLYIKAQLFHRWRETKVATVIRTALRDNLHLESLCCSGWYLCM